MRVIRRFLRLVKEQWPDRKLLGRVALLLVAFAVPLGGAASLLISQQSAKIAVTQRERGGLGFTRRTIEVARTLRGLRDRMLVDRDPGVFERKAVDQALGALYDYNSGEGRSLELTKRLARLADQWELVPPNASGAPAVSAALATALSLFEITDDRSALAADTDPVTESLIDVYGSQMPAVAAQADQAKLLLVRSANENASVDDRIAAAVLLGKARRALEISRTDIDNVARDGTAVAEVEAGLRAVERRLDSFVLIATTSTGRGAKSVRVARQLGDGVLEAVYRLDGSLAGTLRRVLADREMRERRWFTLLRVETLLAVLVAIWFALLLARTIRDRDRRDLERARAEAERLAGELDRQRRLEALAVTEAQLRAVFERSAIGVAILDRDGKVLRSNRALQDMPASFDARRIGSGHPEFRRLLAGEIESFVAELDSASGLGPTSWFEATVSLVRDDVGAPRFAISMLKDVTERKRIDDQLRYDATHDGLSGLPNRAHFVERLRSTFFGGVAPAPGHHAVLFVDLDEFKFINDSLGHGVGDRVLVASGERLRAATGSSDCVARFGGDEFAILLDARATRDEIDAVVDRIGRVLAEPLPLQGQEVFITASIGVAVVHEYYRSVEEILRDADTAMYYAKATGRARSAFFNPTMHDHASRRLELATQLRRALDREQFHLAYQPVVSLVSGAIQSFEVLLRWDHPEMGPVSPGEFIPIAEEIGLIVPIGRFVLERACEQFAAWKRSGSPRPQRFSVNVSVRELLQTDYVDLVEATVRRCGLQPGELILEVTESAVLSSGKFSFGALERLKASGVALAIDDFGTGYSSLRYLQQFPFDQLKIDRSFVGGSDGRLGSEPIVSMLITLAKACGVGIVAEGVETQAQAARLRALGCSSAQGYLFGAAVPAADVPSLFRGSVANFAS